MPRTATPMRAKPTNPEQETAPPPEELDPLFDDEEILDKMPDNPDEALALVNAGLEELAAPSTKAQPFGPGIVHHGVATTANLRSITDIIRDLSRELPKVWLYQVQKGGGTKVTAFSWFRVNQAFDKYAPGWTSEITQLYSAGEHHVVGMRISIPCLEGNVYREDVGAAWEHVDKAKQRTGFDPFRRAKQQALKRAAAQFGFGLYLYDVRRD